MYRSIPQPPNSTRVFTACLLSFMILIAPIASVAAATLRVTAPKPGKQLTAAEKLEASLFEPALAPVVGITATKTDTFPSHPSGQAEPGDAITYDVNIQNTGTDATGVNFNDTIDPNTTLIPGSLKVSPLAFADSYNTAQDAPLNQIAPGVLTNDTGLPAPTVAGIVGCVDVTTPFVCTTTHGSVTLNADGSFTYTPTSGFAGTDTFDYTASNGLSPNDTATATITIADIAPTVSSTTPINGATGVAANSDVTVTFSEPVTASAGAFTISCATSGAHTVVVTGGPTTFTINPNVDFTQGELCTVTVVAAQIADNDANDPPNNMAGNFVFSFTTDAAPTVTATTPTNGATNQTTNTDITLTFSESVSLGATPVTISCTTSGAHTSVVSASPNTTFTVNPNVDFAAGETCTVTVLAAQVTDTDTGDPPDNMAANFVFSFSIDAAPTVNATTPTNGATQVANNANVSITFSESVNLGATPVTISCATSGAHTSVVSASPNTTFTVNPDTDFANGELCTVTVLAAQVTDNDANDPPDNMAANFIFSFTIDNPPSVSSTTPTNGATGVSNATNIGITFNEAVNVSGNWFQMVCDTTTVNPADTAVTGGPTTFTINPTNNLPEGVTCTMTIFAAQVADQDAGDPPDNMAANFVFSFKIPPRAVADARNATGNIRIVTTGRSNFSVFTNDVFPVSDPVTITAFDPTSAHGGNVTMVTSAGTGTFSYNPPPGYEGSDTFNYTITNGAGSSTSTVTITISGMIWFIDDSASSCTTVSAAAGCGRLTNPLSTLASFEAANGNADTPASNIYNPAANDNIFIYSGSYTAPLTLETGQRVIGQGATSSLQTLSGVTPATDSDTLPSTTGLAADRPSITSGGNGFNVVSNNRLYGLAFNNTTGTAINSNANVGTLILDFVAINNSGANGAGVVLDDGGTSVTATGTNTITTTTATALNVTNTTIGASNLTFRSISSSGGSATGIILVSTGSTGALVVTGDGGTSKGGNGTGGTITNKTGGVDGDGTTASGVYVNNGSATLRNMTLTRFDNFGVFGLSVNSVTLQYSTVGAANGGGTACVDADGDIGSSSGAQDAPVVFGKSEPSGLNGFNTGGSATIDNVIVRCGIEHNNEFYQHGGTFTVNYTNSDIKDNSTSLGSDGILIETHTDANAGTPFASGTILVQGNTFDDNKSQVLQANALGDSSIDITINNNTMTKSTQGNEGLLLQNSNDADLTAHVTNNTFTGILGSNIGVVHVANNPSTLGVLTAVVKNNNMTVGAAGGPYPSNRTLVVFFSSVPGQVSTSNVLVESNTINTQSDPVNGLAEPLFVSTPDSNTDPSFTATVLNNTVNINDPGGTSLRGIAIQSTQNVSAGCIDVRGNDVNYTPSAPAGVNGIRVRQVNPATLQMERGNALISATAASALATNNPSSTTEVVGTVTVVENNICQNAPPLLFAPGGVDSSLDWLSAGSSAYLGQPAFDYPNDQPANLSASALVSVSNSLTQQQLDSIVVASVEHWSSTGLTAEQLAGMRQLSFEVGDLFGSYLGEAHGNRIVVDRDAQTKGWFVDATPADDSEFSNVSSLTRRYTDPFNAAAGHVDLLTAIEHEIGHNLGLLDSYSEQDRDSIMYGYLTVGERRVPAKGQAASATPGSLKGSHFLSLPSEVSRKANHVRRALAAHPATTRATTPLAPVSGETVNHTVGTLAGGKTVHIQFQVTVNTPFPGTQVSNQGTVTFNEPGSPVLTDDPSVGGASDQTITPVVAGLSPIVNTLGDAADLSLDGVCDTDAAPGNQCTLRAAIQETNNATSDDTITFDAALNGGTITLDTALDAINGNLTITGPGANLLTVQRNDGAATFFRIFTINSGKTVTISGLTITKGNLASGNGGAVLNNGTLTLTNCNLYNNSTTNNGGGIYNDGPSLTLNTCNVGGVPPLGQPNLAISGGGIFNNSGTLLMTGGSVASNNRGGIFIQSGTVTLNGVSIRDNVINGSGGGVSSAGGVTNISNCLLTNNHALKGGGVFNNGATVTMVNSTISGNDATLEGGGIHNQSGTTTLINATITNNRSDFDNVGAQPGGGIFIAAGTVTLNNTIVSNNFRGTGLTLDDVNGAVDPASLNNLIGDGTGMTGISNGVNGNQVGTAGAPINPRLAALANNGGPTLTHALLAGSPALDAGDNTTATNAGLTTDQRGGIFLRIVDGPDADTTDTVDIGAFEAQVSLPDLADQTINEDGSVTLPFNVGGGLNIVSVTATSSNTTLVPNVAANIDVTGAGGSRTLVINPVANEFGTSTITVTVNGTNSQTMTDTLLLTVNSVNDTPSFTKGADQNVAEDAGAQTVSGWATAISAGAANESGQTLTFLITNNTNSALFSVQPAVSSTGTLTYTPAANTSGTAAITIVLMDNGGGADTSAPQVFNITVNSTNDPPVNTVPGAQSVTENSSLTFSAANSNAISIADVDAGTNPVQVQLTATNGVITLSGISGLSFTVGDGTAEATMTFTGTIANINAALNGLVFTPTAGFSGAASLQIVTNDQGNTGSGGAQSDTDTVNITVNDGGTLQFSAATYSVSENVGNATITITRTGGTAGTATVQFSTSVGGTATAGSDYTAVTNQTVTFNNGDTSKTVDIPINNDLLDENDETVNLTIGSAGGSGVLGSPATAVLTINDDDATPSLSINDVSQNEGNSGTTTFTFTVTLSAASGLPVTVNYATANGTATTADNDYVAVPSTLLTFNPGDTTRTIDVTVNGDLVSEGNQTFFVNLSTPGNATISDNQGLGTIIDDDAVGGILVFSASNYVVAEDAAAGGVQVTVNRTGATTQAVTVDYATSDMTATERRDYTAALGTLKFAAGETTKTFTVLVNVDSFTEGSELVALTLSNPTGGANLGVPQNATVQIDDSLWTGPPANPIDDASFFVRQHYHDFLHREPDAPGLAYWTNEITSCGSNASCTEIKRINVSAAFFLSIEFQETGFTAYLANKVAFNAVPRYLRFERDTQALQLGFIFGAPGSGAVLEANKVAYFNDFVAASDFTTIYGGLSNDQYVDALIANTGVSFTPSERDQLVNGLNNATETRATVLRKITEKSTFKQAEFNRAFVLMEYFGYLRRNPDDAPDNNLDGFNFWFNKLNQFNGNFISAEMVKAFISSIEYRGRFGS